MEIKVGNKYSKNDYNYKCDTARRICKVVNIFNGYNKTKYIEVEKTYTINGLTINGLKDYQVIKEIHFINMFTLIPSFRPHWLLDNGNKIYAEEVDIIDKDWYIFEIGDNFKDYQDYHPLQYKNKESDFGVLFKNGNHMWARWIGEDND
jgi:hypothetical protein